MKQVLRPYQEQAIQGLRESLQVHRSVLLVSPTGSGKTTIGASIIEGAMLRRNRVLFLAHRKELIDQCSKRLDQFSIPHGVIMAGHPRYQPILPVQVASVQTLARRDKPPADIIIIDEAHHARAGTYLKILQAYPRAKIIGLTATPWRTDGKGLGELFDDLIVAATVRELTELGHLVPVTGFAYDHPDLKGVRRRGGDYDTHELELVMSGAKIAGNIVGQYQAHSAGKRAVMFACTVKHSLELVAKFREAGIPAEHVDGETPKEQREGTLERIATGETLVVSNVGILTEGWDLPAVETCILARSTTSLGLYLQMVGRVLRPAHGKTVARIHDHSGNMLEHLAPDAERDYSLGSDTGPKKKSGPSEAVAPLRSCKGCYAVYDATLAACPLCGHANLQPRTIQEVDDDLVTAIPVEDIPKTIETTEKVRFAVYRTLVITQQKRGYRPGWVPKQYKIKFGHWPPREWAREVGA